MGKKRIHELAKELSITNAELIQRITEMNIMGTGKLTSSHSIEDSVADEIRRTVRGKAQAGAQVVVRRRKKQPVPEPAAQESQAPQAQAPEAAGSEPLPEAPAPATGFQQPSPVRIRQKPFERATIVGTSPGKSQDQPRAQKPAAARQGKAPGQQIPDFLKLRPQAPEDEPLEGGPGLPLGEGPDGAQAGDGGPQDEPGLGAQAGGGQDGGLDGSPGQDGGPGQEGQVGQDAQDGQEGDSPSRQPVRPGFPRSMPPAKIVGSMPPRTQGPGYPGAPGANITLVPAPGRGGAKGPGFPGTGRGPGGKVTRELGGQAPGGPRAPWKPRPDTAAPAGDSRPAAKPGFRDQREGAAPPKEGDPRKRDKRKRGQSFSAKDGEGTEAAARSFKRRSIVEHTDLYTDTVWERSRHRKGKGQRKVLAKTELTTPKASKRRIKVDEAITVAELSHRLSLKAGDIIKKLMSMGVMAGVNQSLDFDTASLVANEFGYEVEKSAFDEGDFLPQGDLSDKYETFPRAPVVTIMGHVDHGKTSLLDYIRKSRVQEGEAGGITQHIGAYDVEVGDRRITFLDTPGHEAFTSMRSRGAQVTDIVILIVAADDGVMPQTREAADHAKAAKVPIIVAVNKVDKPGADPEKVRRQMMELGLTQEAWGGDTVFCDISAKTGQGVPELLEMILLQADILNLRARREGPAKGRVIEARLDKGRGAVATVLVEEGTLKQGDSYVCGIHYGKLRALLDDNGERVEEAGPSSPVEIQGISGVPLAGDEFVVMEDEKQARQVSQHRQAKLRETVLVKSTRLTLENLFDHIKAGSVKGLNLVVKADVQGSLEAILDAIGRLSNPEIKISVLHSGTGAVTETDVMLASASSALVICFGLKTAIGRVQEVAEAEQVQIRYYDVIYKLIDDLKEAMAGLLDPVRSEKILGFAEVRAVFNISKVGPVAGSAVTEGRMLRGAKARVHRGKDIVYDGKIGTLKREKNDVREVLEGYECGIGLENYGGVLVGDRIECYQVEEIAPTVELINQAVERAAEQAAEKAAEKAKEEAKEEAAKPEGA
ncbi:MAG: translation initiation factor IF-2 [Deltaproteobacteria bacterium]|jgi:translation initiation factor IF-2|nr:translation initiation factor IF-2 [Deltaproteobacteria bacterium]